MQKGRLITWFDDKGYGFIRPNAGGDDVFLHIRDVISHTKRDPRPGDSFIYEIEIDEEGRARAIKASITGLAFSGFTILGVLAALSFSAYLALAFCHYLPFYPITAIYIGMSLLTIWIYSKDKRAAKLRHWRTKEIRLHLLELLGGWPGAFLAQRFYRHKSRKLTYQFWFWAIGLVHAVLWYQILAPGAWNIPYLPSGQHIRQVVTVLTDSLPKNVISNSGANSEEAPVSGSNQQVSTTHTRSATISCPDSQNNVKVFTGTVMKVNSQSGLTIQFSSTGDGIIQPSALPADFARLFSTGDQVCVSIRQAVIEDGQKSYTLMLVE